jgi:hypothetical protein
MNQEDEAPRGRDCEDGRPEITITVREREVNDAAIAALATDPGVYQRGGVLVRVTSDQRPEARGIRRPAVPRIEQLPAASLREILADRARWVGIREGPNGLQEYAARPPGWCVSAVHARGTWQGIRPLEAVVDYPVLRDDGTVLSEPGYDRDTGLLLQTAAEMLLHVPDCPTLDDAIRARDELLDVVCDFPFERAEHRAAWLAALLTPLARFAFAGPAPLFLVDANTRGAGKGLSLDCIARVVTGERFVVAVYTDDQDELQADHVAGDGGRPAGAVRQPGGKFGDATLDAALTATTWKDRVLGTNRTASVRHRQQRNGRGGHGPADVPHPHRDGPGAARGAAGLPSPQPAGVGGAGAGAAAVGCADRPAGLLRRRAPRPGPARLGLVRGLVGACPVRGGLGWDAGPGRDRLLLQETADVAATSIAALLHCWREMDPEGVG